MGIDLIEMLALQLQSDVVVGDAAARAGKDERAFQRGGCCHARIMGTGAGKASSFRVTWISAGASVGWRDAG